MYIPYRVRQTIGYLRADEQQPPSIPSDARALLNEPMLHQFRILSPADQRHLLDVYRRLKKTGAQQETLVAGLIHDVGKACMKCNITVVDRAAHVVLSKALPGPYRLFASRTMVPFRWMGLHRLANHAERGALAAKQAGYSERVCWLIRHHERGGDINDRELQMLRDADTAAGAFSSKGMGA